MNQQIYNAIAKLDGPTPRTLINTLVSEGMSPSTVDDHLQAMVAKGEVRVTSARRIYVR